MNKTYTKPDIMFEDFSLTSSIASNCAIKTSTSHQWSCHVQIGIMKVFTSQVIGCKQDGCTIIDSGEFNGLCYHVPYNDRNLFMS
ncbi:MAG: hypothetical protein IJB11_06585 [Oscillospiraceae bacterium]|nr:hypothetical protein [Oscillospiraceae bacterium]